MTSAHAKAMKHHMAMTYLMICHKCQREFLSVNTAVCTDCRKEIHARRVLRHLSDLQYDHDRYLDELGITEREYQSWTNPRQSGSRGNE